MVDLNQWIILINSFIYILFQLRSVFHPQETTNSDANISQTIFYISYC